MLASLLLSCVVAAAPVEPSAGVAVLPRREGAVPAATLKRVSLALQQQLEASGLRVRELTGPQKKALASCGTDAHCAALQGKGWSLDALVRADVTLVGNDVALVLTGWSVAHPGVAAEEGLALSSANFEQELSQRAARFVTAVAHAARPFDAPVATAPVPEPRPTVPEPPAPEPSSAPLPEPLPPPPATPVVHTESRTPVLGWVFTASAGAAAIAGGVFTWLGTDAKGRYQASLTTVGGQTASRLSVREANQLVSNGNTDFTVATSLFVAAGAFAIAALIFFLTS